MASRRVWLALVTLGIDLTSASVYGIRISSNSFLVGAFSTIFPAYMTAI